VLFIAPGQAVYEGMIIGENAKPDDLEVNPLKSKQLTNFRSSGKDDAIRLTPPKKHDAGTGHRLYRRRRMVEVTPKPASHPPAQDRSSTRTSARRPAARRNRHGYRRSARGPV
jgi:GTP-binding protein